MTTSTIAGRGEFRSATEKTEGLIQGLKLKPTVVEFSDLAGKALFEGDILLGETSDLQAARERGEPLPLGRMGIGITGETYRWPNKIVPYEIHPELERPERVVQAIAEWTARTPLKFVERTGANAKDYKDFVRFENGDGCASYVGRRGTGKQEIWLGPMCTAGNAIHEIGHAIGLWHEQSREDRDAYVEVHLENVIPRTLHNFNQHVTDGDDIGAYDYESIMHYPRDAFSRNGRDTIVPKGGQAIGQRDRLSAGDVAAVLALYP